LILLSAALAGLAAAAGPAALAQNIDTTTQWNGTTFISSWGYPNTSTYGQTFTPTGTQFSLNNFTFYLSQTGGTAPQYQAFVYEWNAATNRLTGNALFASGVLTAPTGAAYNAVTINTGAVSLVPGKTYVLFLTLSTQGVQATGSYRYGSLSTNTAIPNGLFVFMNNGTNFSLLSTTAWSTIGQDLAAILSFSPPVAYSVNAMGNNAAIGAGYALDALLMRNNGSGDLGVVANAFGNLPNMYSVSIAASQTLPLFNGGLNTITLNSMNDVNRVVQARVDGETGVSAGDSFQGSRDVWMKPYGTMTQQSTYQGVSGYDARNYGVAFGVDKRFSESDRIGAAFAFGQVKVNSHGDAQNNANVQTYTLIGYGRHAFDERTDLSWQVGGGQTDNSGRRLIDFGGLNRIATSNYRAYTAHAGVALGRTYSLGANTTFAPVLRADYAYIRANSYSEDGAGALSLAVDAAHQDQFIVGAEGRLAYRMDGNRLFTANLGVGYDAINQRGSVTASYAGGGPAFATTGISTSPWLLRGGAGFTFLKVRSAQVSLRYDFEVRTSAYSNQTASVNVRLPF
jgi:outer membrane autotransporter protein